MSTDTEQHTATNKDHVEDKCKVHTNNGNNNSHTESDEENDKESKQQSERESQQKHETNRSCNTIEANYLCWTEKEVTEKNTKCLQAAGSPKVLIEACHTGNGSIASTQVASGLQARLYVSIGAQVVLTKNMRQSVGLCNGACGIVKDIVYDPTNPPPALPLSIIIDYGDSYQGPSFFPEDDDKSKWVPCFPETTNWATPHNGDFVQNTRTMFPIQQCNAWTVWKAQGQTMPGKVVLSLGDSGNNIGSSVANIVDPGQMPLCQK